MLHSFVRMQRETNEWLHRAMNKPRSKRENGFLLRRFLFDWKKQNHPLSYLPSHALIIIEKKETQLFTEKDATIRFFLSQRPEKGEGQMPRFIFGRQKTISFLIPLNCSVFQR